LLVIVNILCNVVYIIRDISLWPDPASAFFENPSPYPSPLPRIEASPLSLPPHSIGSYVMWILVIVKTERVSNWYGVQ
jgi:hypothetical protein